MSKSILLAVQAGRVVLSVNDIELHITPEMARKIAEKLPQAADLAEKSVEPAATSLIVPFPREDLAGEQSIPWLPKTEQVVQ